MFLPNVPRRKIYENLLKFEEYVLDLENILRELKNSYSKKTYTFESLDELKYTYLRLKSLIILFLKNEAFRTEKDFEKHLNYLENDEKILNLLLLHEKNLPKNFKEDIKFLNEKLLKLKQKSINKKNYYFFKNLFERLDSFNSYIPKLLELKRDRINKRN